MKNFLVLFEPIHKALEPIDALLPKEFLKNLIQNSSIPIAKVINLQNFVKKYFFGPKLLVPKKRKNFFTSICTYSKHLCLHTSA